MKEATFLFGLPCSGKTTWYQENIKNFGAHSYINADDIKFEYEDYDETVEGMYKDEAIAEAKTRVSDCIRLGFNFVMDAGAINNSYTESLLKQARDQGYYTTLIHIDTPYTVCIERNKKRKRKVPESLILNKEVKRMYHWQKWENSDLVNNTMVVPYFSEEHLFFDMDGVLAIQSNLPKVDGKIDFVNSRYFENLPIVPQVSDIIYDMVEHRPVENFYILSAAPTSISAEEKLRWLKRHFPFIPKKNIFFVSAGKYKAEMFSDLAQRLKLDKREMCLIEDTHSIISEVRYTYGMHSLHISEFLQKYEL